MAGYRPVPGPWKAGRGLPRRSDGGGERSTNPIGDSDPASIPQCNEHYEECIGAKKHLVLGRLSILVHWDQTVLWGNGCNGGNDHR
jgi:hypothetical protein